MVAGNPLYKVVTKLKVVKLVLKAWAIKNRDPKKLMQGKVDSLRVITKAPEEDPLNWKKIKEVNHRRDDLKRHYKTTEKDAK